jgi:hypothetical protein
VAEAIVIAVGTPNCRKIRFRQREVAHQFPLLGWRVKQLCNLGCGQSLPSRHFRLQDLDPQQISQTAQRVD